MLGRFDRGELVLIVRVPAERSARVQKRGRLVRALRVGRERAQLEDRVSRVGVGVEKVAELGEDAGDVGGIGGHFGGARF